MPVFPYRGVPFSCEQDAGWLFSQPARRRANHVESEPNPCRILSASYRKPYQSRHVFAAHQSAIDAGLHIAHYFWWVDRVRTPTPWKKHFLAFTISKNRFLFFLRNAHLPYTKLYDIAVKEGQITDPKAFWNRFFIIPQPLALSGLSRWWKRGRGHRTGSSVPGGGNCRHCFRMHKRGHTGPLWNY